MTRLPRWLQACVLCIRVVGMSLLIVAALHLVVSYFGWSVFATAE